MTPKDAYRQEVLDYRQVFSSPTGQRVLEALKEKFFYVGTTQAEQQNNQLMYNSIAARREVLLHIDYVMNLDLEAQLAMFDQEETITEGDPLDAGQSTERAVSYPTGD